MSRNEIGVMKLATEFECRYCVSMLLNVVVVMCDFECQYHRLVLQSWTLQCEKGKRACADVISIPDV